MIAGSITPATLALTASVVAIEALMVVLYEVGSKGVRGTMIAGADGIELER